MGGLIAWLAAAQSAAAPADDGGMDARAYVGIIAAGVALFGVLLGLWINGRRELARRRHELYSGAWRAVVAYKEFAFAVRRRRYDDRAAERVRISDAMSKVQEDLAYHQALVAQERRGKVVRHYDELVVETRKVAGGLVRASWSHEPIWRDEQMNAPGITKALAPLAPYEQRFLWAIKRDRSWWRRLTSWRPPV